MNEDCEPLREKIRYAPNICGREITTRKESLIVFDKKDIASAVRFYKKYRIAMVRFKKDNPKQAKIFEKKYELIINYALEFYDYNGDKFNDWLLDYCFGDVIEK